MGRSRNSSNGMQVVFNVNLQISKDTKRTDIHRMLTDLKEEFRNF